MVTPTTRSTALTAVANRLMSWVCERCGVSCGQHRRMCTTCNCRTPESGTESSTPSSRGAHRSATKWSKNFYSTPPPSPAAQSGLISQASKCPPASQASKDVALSITCLASPARPFHAGTPTAGCKAAQTFKTRTLRFICCSSGIHALVAEGRGSQGLV